MHDVFHSNGTNGRDRNQLILNEQSEKVTVLNDLRPTGLHQQNGSTTHDKNS